MIKALSLAAALALLPVSAAFAQENPAREQSAEAALEAAAEAFEARMEAFAERAEAIGDDESLTEAQQEAAVMALWAEYQPAVAEFTASIHVPLGIPVPLTIRLLVSPVVVTPVRLLSPCVWLNAADALALT